HERPVHLLDVQYRMHPEIAHFPSKHVYNDNIHTDSSVFKRSFPIKKPYALFNVHGGRELNDRKG
ncbi:putative helicase senataxin, partial [Exaiptasia diaphana]